MKHEAGRTAALHQVKHWFLDLDGTTYLGDTPLPGALAFVHHLRRHGIGYTFLTNNSSKSASEYGDKLQRLGFPVSEQRVFSSARATGRYLQQQLPGARVFLLGTSSFAAELGSFGVDLVEEHADTVVLGYDTFLTYPRLATACRLLAAGARYIASHPDINCPSPQGPLPDAGAVMALLAASTGRQPDTIVGKPSVRFLHEAAEQAGVALSDCG
ncbi:MAG TPA: hypothetical protein VF171_08290, partial [Trueperaceae bacterium]